MDQPTTAMDTGEVLTARDVLSSDPAAVRGTLEQVIGEEHLMKSLPPGATAAASKFLLAQAAAAVDEILGALRVDDVLVGGWMQIDELRAAVEETSREGGSRHVALSSHSIASEHSPSVEVMINQVPAKLLDLGLDLGFTLSACELLVERGKITGVELGSVNARGELKAADRTLLHRDSNRLDTDRLFTALGFGSAPAQDAASA